RTRSRPQGADERFEDDAETPWSPRRPGRRIVHPKPRRRTASMRPLKLVIFDATDTRRRAPSAPDNAAPRRPPARSPDGSAGLSPGLTPIWRAGAFLHCVARAADARLAASRWDEALAWVARMSREHGRKVGSIQVWGHGGWGYMQ